MKIEFDVDISDLESMNAENLVGFLQMCLVVGPITELTEELAKAESEYPNPACRKAVMRICKDNISLGHRLIASMKVNYT